LNWRDRLGFAAMRFGFGRDRYSIEPGLYAAGSPNLESPVLVTANYKMTFDILRSNLTGINAWILVLDTHGINVWCAAGKGTFGTDEIVQKIKQVRLDSVVSHKNIVVPQLGAPGIAAHEVKQQTGFRVNYGPIRADGIKKYLDAGMKATPDMRQFRFPLNDRIALAPLELTVMFKWIILLILFLAGMSGFHASEYSPQHIINTGIPAVIILTAAWIAAGFLITALLPYIPVKMLSLKGMFVGFPLAVLGGIYWENYRFDNAFGMDGLGLMIIGISGYLGLVLTGSMPYTSISGVKIEMRKMLPVIAAIFSLGLTFWTVGRFL
jgi:acetyl-CoA decarbonylase/synthase complex subunit gamma